MSSLHQPAEKVLYTERVVSLDCIPFVQVNSKVTRIGRYVEAGLCMSPVKLTQKLIALN